MSDLHYKIQGFIKAMKSSNCSKRDKERIRGYLKEAIKEHIKPPPPLDEDVKDEE